MGLGVPLGCPHPVEGKRHLRPCGRLGKEGKGLMGVWQGPPDHSHLPGLLTPKSYRPETPNFSLT